MEIDIESLRNTLMNYYGIASRVFPNAYMNVFEVENASDAELIELAISLGIDLGEYEIGKVYKC